MNNEVIACSLDGVTLRDRMAWIASLNARSLRSWRRSDLALTLDYETAAIEDVRKMVAGEQACCAFLHFTVAEYRDFVRVSIIAPEGAREAAEALFEPFAAREPLALTMPCGCKSECGA